MEHPTKRKFVGWVLLLYLAVWCVGAARMDTGYVGRRLDDGIYFVTARSIRDGNGYRLPSRPGDPIARKYPPGFPLTLAGAMKLAPGAQTVNRDIRFARIVVATAAAVFLWLSYILLLRFRMRPMYAVLAVVAMSVHPTLIAESSAIMSDSLYSALVVAIVLLAMTGSELSRRRSMAVFFVSGSMAACAFYVRSNGIALFPALIAQAAMLPRRKLASGAAVIAGILLVIAPATVALSRQAGPPDSGSYSDEFASGWATPQTGISLTIRNAEELNPVIAAMVMPLFWSTQAARLNQRFHLLFGAMELASSGLVALGAIHLARRTIRKYIGLWIFVALSIGILLIWPWNLSGIGNRMLIVLFAPVVLTLIAGLHQLMHLARLPVRHPARLALALFGTAVLLSFASFSYRLARGGDRLAHEEQRRLGAYIATAATLPAKAVVVSQVPELINIYTGRIAVPLLEDDDALAHRYGRWTRIQSWMRAAPSSQFYLVAPPPDEDPQVAALLRDGRTRVEIVSRTPGCLVGRIENNPER